MLTLRKKASLILNKLIKYYPDADIELDYDKDNNWQLLVVVALSAQSTDKAVNKISPNLFKRFKSVEDFAKASPEQIEPYIKSLGLYRNKAKNLCLAAQKIMSDFNGEIPRDRTLLETLAGVGKKTSAVIVSQAFNIAALAVDTHVARVTFRLGLSHSHLPHKIEEELTALLAPSMLTKAHITFIFHGRRICVAKKPHCSICPVADLCPRLGVKVWQ
jgi:endonuclease-3